MSPYTEPAHKNGEAGSIHAQPWYKHAKRVLSDSRDVSNNPIYRAAKFVKEMTPLMRSKAEVVEWADKRIDDVLNNLDYAEILIDVDNSDSSMHPAVEIWGDVTSDYESIVYLRNNIEYIRRGGKISLESARVMRNVLIDIERLEKRVASYGADNQEVYKTEIANDELLERVERVIYLSHSEDSFRARAEPKPSQSIE